MGTMLGVMGRPICLKKADSPSLCGRLLVDLLSLPPKNAPRTPHHLTSELVQETCRQLIAQQVFGLLWEVYPVLTSDLPKTSLGRDRPSGPRLHHPLCRVSPHRFTFGSFVDDIRLCLSGHVHNTILFAAAS